MGGKEALKKLIEIDPTVNAIVSSGYAMDATMSRYQDFGFRGVIAKPYEAAEWDERCAKLSPPAGRLPIPAVPIRRCRPGRGRRARSNCAEMFSPAFCAYLFSVACRSRLGGRNENSPALQGRGCSD